MTAETQLAAIASRYLGADTLAERHSDALDFHDVHVGNIRAALLAAYEAGKTAAHASIAPWRVANSHAS